MTPAERQAILEPPVPAASDDALAEPELACKPAGGATWLLAVVGVVVVLAAARIAYLYLFCPYNLVEDEAHYWEWSRRLGMSYYSKGPGIALLIRAATDLLGVSEAAIRVPAAVAGSVAAFATAGLAAEAARTRRGPDWRVGMYALAAFALSPINEMPALLSTIDGPYVACWAVAAWAALRALRRRSRLAWLVLGAAIAVGFLIKYTILLLVPGLVLFALVHRSRLRLARRWPDLLLGAVVLVLAGIAPVVIWNAEHGWPTAHHLLGHLGMRGGDMPIPASAAGPFDWAKHVGWLAEFIGTQLGMVGPLLLLGLLAVAWAWRRRADNDEHDSGRLFLIWCAAPIIVFYVVVAFFSEAEGNWAMGGYVSLLALAGWFASEEMPRYRALVRRWRASDRRPWRGIFRRQPETVGQVLWHISVVWGLVAGLAMFRLDWVGRTLGLEVPVGRLMGAPSIAKGVAAHAEQLRDRTGLQPFYMANHYGRASQLAYYLPGRPDVFCMSQYFGGRPSQYDFWPDTDPSRPDLLGRPAVMMGSDKAHWERLFDRVELIGRLEGEHKQNRFAFYGYGYHGPHADGGAKAP